MSRDLPRVLIVDDDAVTCELLCEVFQRQGFNAHFEQSGDAALSVMTTHHPDVVISDIRMKTRLDGLTLLDHVRTEFPQTPVVLMTAFGSIDTAIRAVKRGAFDYISKPFKMETVISTVRRALVTQSARSSAARSEMEDAELSSGLVGRTPEMLAIYKMIACVSDARAPVLITGESGTGKELIARAIHGNSPSLGEPFVAVNCGALAETLLESELFGHVKGSFTGAIANKRGIFEVAAGGTVFLDEISETSVALQVKLLRVLQEREVLPVGGNSAVKVRARVIAACNRDLEELCDQGTFRRDIFYRLNVINIHVPPLRERRDDIPLLAAHLLRKHTPKGEPLPVMEESTLNLLNSYAWPGNVRELENVIERALTLCDGTTIRPEDVELRGPPSFEESVPLHRPGTLPQTLEDMERASIRKALEDARYNKTAAARALGISFRALRYRIKKLGIE